MGDGVICTEWGQVDRDIRCYFQVESFVSTWYLSLPTARLAKSYLREKVYRHVKPDAS
jgi:hypothetical protein